MNTVGIKIMTKHKQIETGDILGMTYDHFISQFSEQCNFLNEIKIKIWNEELDVLIYEIQDGIYYAISYGYWYA